MNPPNPSDTQTPNTGSNSSSTQVDFTPGMKRCLKHVLGHFGMLSADKEFSEFKWGICLAIFCNRLTRINKDSSVTISEKPLTGESLKPFIDIPRNPYVDDDMTKDWTFEILKREFRDHKAYYLSGNPRSFYLPQIVIKNNETTQ
ncbi:hypothetical protein GLAREA_09697 [Glarea lozoyensis ATCC 20868]|uniref:Uncharacterized protein n=1 Tax=Glarea lozoyensis (strain ATCC 20868 / MF5171) TaxID=1116229 RepID=S3D9A0_GLAL2|nr:uncharacterized protein GLAREA_09697 [Glarea lozoyensis ATCC 20868]EPE28576.1 hypothetical protein GLAREA_09697 [Glarea lozoyensis ATCC 20868]